MTQLQPGFILVVNKSSTESLYNISLYYYQICYLLLLHHWVFHYLMKYF